MKKNTEGGKGRHIGLAWRKSIWFH